MRSRTLVLWCASSVACGHATPSTTATPTNAPQIARALALLEGCLLGPGAITANAPAATSRARRMALGQGGVWPDACVPLAQTLRREGDGAHMPGASIARLEEHLTAAHAHVPRFVEGSESGDAAVAWIADVLTMHREVSTWLSARSVSPLAPSLGARAPLATITQDVAPMPLGDDGVRVGSSSAGGTLTVLFRDAGASVVCRTRDRGATLRCRRAADDAPRGALRAVVSHDRAEALGLFERAGTYRIEALDVPDITAFSLPGEPVAMRVSADVLYAAVRSPRGDRLLREVRSNPPTEVPTRLVFADGAVVASGGNPSVHQAFGRTTAHDAPALGAQPFAPASPQWLSVLGRSASRLVGCQGPAESYLAASSEGRTDVIRFDGTTARVVGTLALSGAELQMACDALGVTVWQGDSVGSCAGSTGCGALQPVAGVMALSRREGEILGIASATGGALRVLRGRAGAALTRTALADDAAHGGVSADRVWLERVDAGAVLMTHGAVNAVLWSADGVTWRSSREAD